MVAVPINGLVALGLWRVTARLSHRIRLVQVRSTARNRKLGQWVTDPGVLLWVDGLGCLPGELTQHHRPQPQRSGPSPDSGHPFFDTARNLITPATWARPLLSALPDTSTQPSCASDGSTPASPIRSEAASSAKAQESWSKRTPWRRCK